MLRLVFFTLIVIFGSLTPSTAGSAQLQQLRFQTIQGIFDALSTQNCSGFLGFLTPTAKVYFAMGLLPGFSGPLLQEHCAAIFQGSSSSMLSQFDAIVLSDNSAMLHWTATSVSRTQDQFMFDSGFESFFFSEDSALVSLIQNFPSVRNHSSEDVLSRVLTTISTGDCNATAKMFGENGTLQFPPQKSVFTELSEHRPIVTLFQKLSKPNPPS